MEEKKNYIIYTNANYGIEKLERVVKITKQQADAIQWVMDNYDIDGSVILAEEYEGEEI